MFLFLNVHSQEESNKTNPAKGHNHFFVSVGSYSGIFTRNAFTPMPNSTSVHNIGFGVYYEYYSSDSWSIKTGLTYDPKGRTSTILDADYKLRYLTLPVLASWHFGEKRRWYLNFGLYLGFLVSSNLSDLGLSGLLKDYDSGFDLGVGIRIPVGSHMFYVELDRQTGAVNPSKSGISSGLMLSRTALSVGYIF